MRIHASVAPRYLTNPLSTSILRDRVEYEYLRAEVARRLVDRLEVRADILIGATPYSRSKFYKISF
jgi:hypothetical protein